MSTLSLFLASVVLSTTLVVWCWVRFLRQVPQLDSPLLKKLTSVAGLVAVSVSCVILTLFLVSPAGALGIHGAYQGVGPFLFGAVAALLGGVVAMTAVKGVRKPLAFSSLSLLVGWAILLSSG